MNGINEFANTIKPKKAVPNLGKEERIALTWLKDNTQNKNLAVLKADKGGAKVLLKRDQVSEMIKSKLQNQNLYTDMGPENPMPAIMKKLRDHWVTAVKHNHISMEIAQEVVGVTVYYKDTDAHRYLSYLSIHPPHTFKSVIYSSFLRLRRIVIDQNLLEFRLLEMHSFLKASDYPDNLLYSIRNDVFSKDRDINYRNRVTDRRFDVGWVTTFGPGYGEVKKLISRINKTLLTSPLFSEIKHPVFGVVSRRAPNLRDILFSREIFVLTLVEVWSPPDARP